MSTFPRPVGGLAQRPVLHDAAALGAMAGERAERLLRWAPELRSADPGEELSALLGALAETASRLQDRCAELQGGPFPAAPARPSLVAAAPTVPQTGTPDAAPELSTPALVALDLLAQGATRAEAEAHLSAFGVSDPREVLRELDRSSRAPASR